MFGAPVCPVPNKAGRRRSRACGWSRGRGRWQCGHEGSPNRAWKCGWPMAHPSAGFVSIGVHSWFPFRWLRLRAQCRLVWLARSWAAGSSDEYMQPCPGVLVSQKNSSTTSTAPLIEVRWLTADLAKHGVGHSESRFPFYVSRLATILTPCPPRGLKFLSLASACWAGPLDSPRGNAGWLLA